MSKIVLNEPLVNNLSNLGVLHTTLANIRMLDLRKHTTVQRRIQIAVQIVVKNKQLLFEQVELDFRQLKRALKKRKILVAPLLGAHNDAFEVRLEKARL